MRRITWDEVKEAARNAYAFPGLLFKTRQVIRQSEKENEKIEYMILGNMKVGEMTASQHARFQELTKKYDVYEMLTWQAKKTSEYKQAFEQREAERMADEQTKGTSNHFDEVNRHLDILDAKRLKMLKD